MGWSGGSALEKVQPRVVSYDEQVTLMREHLASVLEVEEQWAKAALVLAGIDLDSGCSPASFCALFCLCVRACVHVSGGVLACVCTRRVHVLTYER